MSRKEADARRMVEQLQKLPDRAQERIGYIIEGAHLVSDERNRKSGDGTEPENKNCVGA